MRTKPGSDTSSASRNPCTKVADPRVRVAFRTREGMAVARAKGRLRGRQLKLAPKQQTELRRMHATGDYSITDLAELFTVSRPTCTEPGQTTPPLRLTG